MAQTMPVTFDIPGERAIASYNFVDIASGTGYIVFYASNTSDDYILSNTATYSKNVMRNTQYTGTAENHFLSDTDFDITFKKPQTLQGEAVINIPLGFFNNASEHLRTPTQYVIIKLRKWNGTTETEIANKTGTSWSVAVGNNATVTTMDAITVTIPETHFKIGETLRVTVEHYGWGNGTPITMVYFYGHDPMGRARSGFDTASVTFGTDTSQMTVQIPLRIEL